MIFHHRRNSPNTCIILSLIKQLILNISNGGVTTALFFSTEKITIMQNGRGVCVR
ncbi:unnamed protein product [Nippostrongylus brasiliensis]|uniref:Uncharacterized protein n=1 Tax=Nippostrongylus brasiliensis TaxID=27835 RepID=A0A0N4Y3A8_NIPBR|nr:unnamed protein product [Nippostrongylus brasiliensis]